ncbi:hypothetical protein SSX86_030295 [Deinandra increscens subsp. villosa]|uniref:Uncharacterized protein n=1 Tax=Deinandra increscens subsp. villosa TaxID=3103831 RepID=A0AAP0GK88_9ASTR
MAFDPLKSPHYKILYARMAPPEHLFQAQIEIYSSETCNWSVCGDLLPYNHLQGFWGGIYWNGGIHWLRYRLDVEDPHITVTTTPQTDGGIHWLKYRLDVEHPYITVTPTPPTAVGGVHKLFESGGCLFLLCTPVDSEMQLHIYEMCKRRLVWVEKYIVDVGDIMMKYRKTWMKKHHRRNYELEWLLICSRVQCIVIEKKEDDDDSFLVVEIFGKIIQYKIVSKTIHKLYELREPDRYYSSDSINFIASFADV